MRHKCDSCRNSGEHHEMGFKPFGVCLCYGNLIEAEKAYKAEKCPFEKSKTTNFDRIKAMSIEEMAKFLVELIMQQKHALNELENASVIVIEAVRRDCYMQTVYWLESEVQGE